MKKDVVYIDVEDDITAIIGKVKSSKEKIVALVPPKRIGVLQSAVNLRLLQRAASQADKRIVLITNNQALSALSAAASIPIAKNLQSKPEIAEIPALDIDNGEDIIDGAKLPVGDHVKATGVSKTADKDEELVKGVNLDEGDEGIAPKAMPRTGKGKKPTGRKVPDFNTFRKKLFIGISAGVVLVGVLIWAFVFAPSARVVITARTTPVPVSGVVTLGASTDIQTGSVKAAVETIEREASVDFEATGEKDVGDKATGTVAFSTRDTEMLGTTIAAGTKLYSSSGMVYVTDAAVTITFNNRRDARVGVTAAESGESYNAASGKVTGVPSGISASFVDATSGGSSKKVPIVTAADVQGAKEKLAAESTDTIRAELKKKFPDSVRVIDTSFAVERQDASSAPAIGQEAPDKKAKITSKVAYRMYGLATSELDAYVTDALKKQMPDQTAQKVYKTGVDDIQLNDFARRGDTPTVRLVATGYIGPIVHEDEIKETVAGRRFGDIQNQLTKIDGVNDVEVKFPYFWVRTVPKNIDKITVEFNIENAGE